VSAGGDARVEAARVLAGVLGHEGSLDTLLPAADARLADTRDRALLRAIVLATLRGVFRLDALLGLLLAKPLPPRERAVHALLLAGLAQLELAITPAHAAISGSVAAARTLRRPQHAALVNAVLRRYQRERAALLARLPDDDTLRFDHPRWLIEALRAAWPADYAGVLAANNAPAPLWLRVNRRRTTRERCLERLQAHGLAATVDDALPDALRLDTATAIAALPGFDEGLVSVQDGAAQLAVELIAAAPGQRVLDACAAPGGKCAHLLERAPGAGRAGRARRQAGAARTPRRGPGAARPRRDAARRRRGRAAQLVGRPPLRPHPDRRAMHRHRRDPASSRHPPAAPRRRRARADRAAGPPARRVVAFAGPRGPASLCDVLGAAR
jgi:16S rRNA (cytosine967-C5)-methyltransferase